MKDTAKNTKIRDGWHIVNGWNVYVEDGYVVRGVSSDGTRPLYLYEAARGVLDRVYHVPFGGFRGRMNRGTIVLR